MCTIGPVVIDSICIIPGQGMLGWDDMAPPEFSQHLETEPPVVFVTLDMEQRAAIDGPHI